MTDMATLQRLGQEFDGDDIDVCAACGEIVCDHSDAEYLGWREPASPALIPLEERR